VSACRRSLRPRNDREETSTLKPTLLQLLLLLLMMMLMMMMRAASEAGAMD